MGQQQQQQQQPTQQFCMGLYNKIPYKLTSVGQQQQLNSLCRNNQQQQCISSSL